MSQVRKKSSYNLRRSRDSRVQIRLFCPRHPFISLLRVQIGPFCPRRSSHCPSRVQIVGFCSRRLILVRRLRGFAPVGFNGCCPELRQGPAQPRVLRNSPRAMPLFGLPIIVMTAMYTSRKQGKLQRACACRGPGIYVCRSGSFAHVIPLFHCHVYRLGLFAPVTSDDSGYSP